MSYRAVDPNKFFAENEKFSEIDGATVLLEKPYEINWPCSREEELRWHRNVTQQDPTMPIFKCLPSRELSSSLMLDVVPWCLFINSIGCTVQLINTTDSNCCLIHSNNIAMPFVISVGLRLIINVKIFSNLYFYWTELICHRYFHRQSMEIDWSNLH